MQWSVPIGVVKGTVIRVHLTFLLFLVWIGVSHYAQGGRDAAVQGIVFIVLLFACVLLHEFGHVFAARRYGIRRPTSPCCPSAAWRSWSACRKSRPRSSWSRWPARPSTS